jgi:pimeloyl-ACP methyl ester carboxylesterase
MAPFDPGPPETEKRDVRLASEWQADTGGVVGWSGGGWGALALAATRPELPRLVIVSLPYPEDEIPAVDLDAVVAKTLLLYGSADPRTGSSHGTRWQKRLPNARLEMVPGGDHDLLVPMWARVLSHLAPRRTNR